jgi:hypothetical protein
VTTASWPGLIDELDRWQQAGRAAELWWRDDDAVAPSAALERLVSLDETIPLALAVIPASAEPDLAAWLADRAVLGRPLAVLQHGWRHANHAESRKKSEFPGDRPVREVVAELAGGRDRLVQLFGARALPVLVPPWNRFADALLPLLGDCGLTALSRSKPRRTPRTITGVIEANIHVDLVAWADDRGFIGEEAALGALVAHLRGRRLGWVSGTEPTGILTHHRVQDGATEAFLDRLFGMTGAHPAVRWLDATAVFASAEAVPA